MLLWRVYRCNWTLCSGWQATAPIPRIDKRWRCSNHSSKACCIIWEHARYTRQIALTRRRQQTTFPIGVEAPAAVALPEDNEDVNMGGVVEWSQMKLITFNVYVVLLWCSKCVVFKWRRGITRCSQTNSAYCFWLVKTVIINVGYNLLHSEEA